MFKIHAYLDGEIVINWHMEHLPRLGDTMRFKGKNGDRFGKVTEVVWCMDEEDSVGQRVNIGLERTLD